MNLREALMKAGKTRFRPVVLTAITTVLGLVPLAIVFNLDFITLLSEPAEFFTNIGQYFYWGGPQGAWWAPMALAVICALIFATLLTLVLVPVLYYMFENGRTNINRFFFDTANPGIIDPVSTNGKREEKKHHDSVSVS